MVWITLGMCVDVCAWSYVIFWTISNGYMRTFNRVNLIWMVWLARLRADIDQVYQDLRGFVSYLNHPKKRKRKKKENNSKQTKKRETSSLERVPAPTPLLLAFHRPLPSASSIALLFHSLCKIPHVHLSAMEVFTSPSHPSPPDFGSKTFLDHNPVPSQTTSLEV